MGEPPADTRTPCSALTFAARDKTIKRSWWPSDMHTSGTTPALSRTRATSACPFCRHQTRAWWQATNRKSDNALLCTHLESHYERCGASMRVASSADFTQSGVRATLNATICVRDTTHTRFTQHLDNFSVPILQDIEKRGKSSVAG